jgi:hypothetical protein
VAGFCEHGNKTSGSIKKAGYCLFFNKLSNYRLFKEYPATWSWLVVSTRSRTREHIDTHAHKYIVLQEGHDALRSCVCVCVFALSCHSKVLCSCF